jgi:hypothetical protein
VRRSGQALVSTDVLLCGFPAVPGDPEAAADELLGVASRVIANW